MVVSLFPGDSDCIKTGFLYDTQAKAGVLVMSARLLAQMRQDCDNGIVNYNTSVAGTGEDSPLDVLLARGQPYKGAHVHTSYKYTCIYTHIHTRMHIQGHTHACWLSSRTRLQVCVHRIVHTHIHALTRTHTDFLASLNQKWIREGPLWALEFISQGQQTAITRSKNVSDLAAVSLEALETAFCRELCQINMDDVQWELFATHEMPQLVLQLKLHTLLQVSG